MLKLCWFSPYWQSTRVQKKRRHMDHQPISMRFWRLLTILVVVFSTIRSMAWTSSLISSLFFFPNHHHLVIWNLLWLRWRVSFFHIQSNVRRWTHRLDRPKVELRIPSSTIFTYLDWSLNYLCFHQRWSKCYLS